MLIDIAGHTVQAKPSIICPNPNCMKRLFFCPNGCDLMKQTQTKHEYLNHCQRCSFKAEFKHLQLLQKPPTQRFNILELFWELVDYIIHNESHNIDLPSILSIKK